VTNTQVYLIVAVILVLLDLVTVTARISFLHSGLSAWVSASAPTDRKSQQTLSLLQRLPRLQASLNLAQNIWRFLLAGVSLLILLAQPVSLTPLILLGLLLLVALLVFWLEWAVRGIVLRSPNAWALRTLPLARLLSFLLAPLVIPVMFFYARAQNPLGEAEIEFQEQLRNLVDAVQQSGLIEQGESKMIHSIFELSDTLAREIMVPRIDILALDVLTPLGEAVDAFLRSGHSRVPVFQESVDNILGLLYAKDLLRAWHEGNPIESLQSLLRPAYFVPEAKKINELLAEMQRRRVHMAIIVDEYGGIAGLVTLEDIVEEILGEIQDEYDQGEELPYQLLPNGEYLFQGRIDLDDFNEVLSTHLVKEEADTLGGFIYNRIGRVPTVGESVQIDNLLLSVEQVISRRIRKVRASWLPPILEKDEKIAHADG
jgi:CBS domain containing-hemolysin-like protein